MFKSGLFILFLFGLHPSTSVFADNGRVLHLGWEEDESGSIIENSNSNLGLYVFEQRNQFFHYKDPNNPLFKIRYKWLDIEWTIVHFIAIALTLILQFLTFRWINRRMAESRFFKRWSYRFLKLCLWLGVIAGNAFVVWAIDYYTTQVHFRYHKLVDFKNASPYDLKKGLHDHTYFDPIESNWLKVQLYIKKDGKWHTQKAMPVLHFQRDSDGKLSFLNDNSFVDQKHKIQNKKAITQLIAVHQKINNKDTSSLYTVENHKLTAYKLSVDKCQRVLLLVNGYRPISNSADPEKAFEAINNKGLENPTSKNLIFYSDLFNYWPKDSFIEILKKRIEPNQVLYADGHHSVSTSNHRSLIQFVSTSALYPKPCKGQHHCKDIEITEGKKVNTYTLLATNPNYKGFEIRYKAGKQAGRNLLQELSKGGNSTLNDTLYVVSHSMGHAYFMGMASILRGKIQFSNYWTFAPENPTGRWFAAIWWKQCYQYGTQLYGPNRHAPCQQDGVAPQRRVRGLEPIQQILFPLGYKDRLGYLKSHYIGYYDWAFKIPPKQPGYIGRN